MLWKIGCAVIVALAGSALHPDSPRRGVRAGALAANGVSVAADTAVAKLAIRGMTCSSCATTARIALERAEGVHRARVSWDSASAVVHYDPERTTPARFMAKLKEMTGYEATLVAERAGRPRAESASRDDPALPAARAMAARSS